MWKINIHLILINLKWKDLLAMRKAGYLFENIAEFNDTAKPRYSKDKQRKKILLRESILFLKAEG